MRGQHLFNDLFADAPTLVLKQENKGRNEALNAQRDDLLLHRFFYYGKYHNHVKYDVIIEWLSAQFFLTERRIQDIISDNSLNLRQLRQNPPAISDMKKRWPHLMW